MIELEWRQLTFGLRPGANHWRDVGHDTAKHHPVDPRFSGEPFDQFVRVVLQPRAGWNVCLLDHASRSGEARVCVCVANVEKEDHF